MQPESTGQRKLVAHYGRINVQVTQEHIELATRRDSSHCMIADALQTALPGVKNISVDLQTIRFTDPKREQRYTYLTPPLSQAKLIAFDQGLALEPFEFSLRSAVQVTRAGAGHRGKSSRYEGMAKTRSSKTGVKLGGEPMPVAVLHSGPGTVSREVREHLDMELAAENYNEEPSRTPETQPLAKRRENPTGEPETDLLPKRSEEPTPDPETETPPKTENVTLSTRRGRTRQYGLRQLKL